MLKKASYSDTVLNGIVLVKVNGIFVKGQIVGCQGCSSMIRIFDTDEQVMVDHAELWVDDEF